MNSLLAHMRLLVLNKTLSLYLRKLLIAEWQIFHTRVIDKRKQFACLEFSDTLKQADNWASTSQEYTWIKAGVHALVNVIPTCLSINVEPVAQYTSVDSPIVSTEQHTTPTNCYSNKLWGRLILFGRALLGNESLSYQHCFYKKCSKWYGFRLHPDSQGTMPLLSKEACNLGTGRFLQAASSISKHPRTLEGLCPSRNMEAPKICASLRNNGKTTTAIKLFTNSMEGRVLHLSEEQWLWLEPSILSHASTKQMQLGREICSQVT
jgi:hypothetical protein